MGSAVQWSMPGQGSDALHYAECEKIHKCKENCKTEKYKKKKNLKIRCVVLNKVINNQINDAI